MGERLTQLYESLAARDLVEIAILAVAIFAVLRFLGKTRGAGLVRGLGIVVVCLFLVAGVSFYVGTLKPKKAIGPLPQATTQPRN